VDLHQRTFVDGNVYGEEIRSVIVSDGTRVEGNAGPYTITGNTIDGDLQFFKSEYGYHYR
jgi:hypothetical protein